MFASRRNTVGPVVISTLLAAYAFRQVGAHEHHTDNKPEGAAVSVDPIVSPRGLVGAAESIRTSACVHQNANSTPLTSLLLGLNVMGAHHHPDHSMGHRLPDWYGIGCKCRPICLRCRQLAYDIFHLACSLSLACPHSSLRHRPCSCGVLPWPRS